MTSVFHLSLITHHLSLFVSMGLFSALEPSEGEKLPRPLADRMRPRTLEELVGQQHLLAPGKPLRTQLERDDISSLILWGPPG